MELIFGAKGLEATRERRSKSYDFSEYYYEAKRKGEILANEECNEFIARYNWEKETGHLIRSQNVSEDVEEFEIYQAEESLLLKNHLCSKKYGLDEVTLFDEILLQLSENFDALDERRSASWDTSNTELSEDISFVIETNSTAMSCSVWIFY